MLVGSTSVPGCSFRFITPLLIGRYILASPYTCSYIELRKGGETQQSAGRRAPIVRVAGACVRIYALLMSRQDIIYTRYIINESISVGLFFPPPSHVAKICRTKHKTTNATTSFLCDIINMARPLVSVAAGLAAVSVASGATLLPAGESNASVVLRAYRQLLMVTVIVVSASPWLYQKRNPYRVTDPKGGRRQHSSP